MAFLFYFAVLLFAAASAVFGLDLMTSPLPQHHAKPVVADTMAPSKQSGAQTKKVATNSDKANSGNPVSPIHAAKPSAPKSEVRTVYPPSNPALGAVVAKQNEANAAARNSSPPQQATGQPAANTQAQQLAARPEGDTTPDANSARAEATGSTPKQQTDTANAAAEPQQASNQCNIQVCASAYRSFRASDCTYQPFEGPRRVCTKSTAPSSRVASHPAQPQEPKQARSGHGRSVGFREAERRGRAMRDPDEGYDEYDDASIFDSLFGRHNRRVIVVPDDRYRDYYR